MRPLRVAGGIKCDGTKSARGRGVGIIRIFVYLAILSIMEQEIFVAGIRYAHDGTADAAVFREGFGFCFGQLIEACACAYNRCYDHDGGDSGVWETVHGGAVALLDCTDGTLHLGNMIILGSDVGNNGKDVGFETGKFAIALHNANLETARVVHACHVIEFLKEGFLLAIANGGDSPETECFGDGVEKQATLNVEQINA